MIIYNQKTFKIVSPQKTTVVGSKLWYNNNQTNFALFGGNFGLARPDGLFTCHLFHIALGIGIGTGAEWFFMVRTPA